MRGKCERRGRSWRHPAVLLGCLLRLAGAAAAESPTPTPEALEHFEKRVRPVLVERCYPCHSSQAEKVKGGLLLDTRAGWQKGGSSGTPALLPGDPDKSRLIQAIRYNDPELAMPPKGRLSPDQVADLEAWVRMGAPDPRQGGTTLPNPQDQARSHWAFQPVRKPTPPEVRNPAWIRSPVDRFILARMEQQGLRPSPQADRRTLLRRANFLLTGLPPSAEEVAAFEADETSEAFERVIDRLLSSPRYGERWGRYWLDIARYADTKGYVFEEERRYPYAYTYRDWVIRAFNEDKPYDRFLLEQIAGDRLATPDDPSPLAALGFLTLGRRFLNNPHDIIDDRIDVLMRGTQALTVGCARCHDHKYDPVPSSDYYSLYGVFASSQEPAEKPLLGSVADPVRQAEFEQELAKRVKERDEFVRTKESEHRQKLRRTIGDYLLAAHVAKGLEPGKREEAARSRKLSPLVVGRWLEALERYTREPEPLFAAWIALAQVPPERFLSNATAVAASIAGNPDGRHHPKIARAFEGTPPASLEEVARRYNELFSDPGPGALQEFLEAKSTPLDLRSEELHRLFDVPEAQRKRALQRAVEELQATHPGAPPRAMVLLDNPVPTEPVVFKRGNPGNPGEKVPRRFLEVIAGSNRKPFVDGSGRLELARAIASADNPLTARVFVNRVWLQLFGAGLVRTPSDFGLRSDPPTHPELLDWLAATFMEEGWSPKNLIRHLLLSATWQQTSDATADAADPKADPDNRWWSRQTRRRLDFESTRDFLLQAGGQLDLSMGGHSVEIAAKDYRSRRTVYGFVERQNLPGMFRTFDFASPDTTSAQRFQTTVPQQALYFMNSPFALDQVRRFAARPDVVEAGTTEARVRRMYEIAFQRPPQPEELDLARRFLEEPSATETGRNSRTDATSGSGSGAATPTVATAVTLSKWERYAQVLLMANEAVFYD